MSQKKTLVDAVIFLINDQVDATPAVDKAWQAFCTTYQAADAILKEAGHKPVAYALEEAVNAYRGEAVRAAFLAGLTFDVRALLLE